MNIPIGGFSFFIHLLIAITPIRILNKTKSIHLVLPFLRIALLIIITGILILFSSTLTQLMKLNKSVITNTIEMVFNPCIPFPTSASSKKVILRLDDVQSFYFVDTSEKMISDAHIRKMRMTIGLIPKDLGSDKNIVTFLKKNSCNLELALHGWDHQKVYLGFGEYAEFEKIGGLEALSRIEQGKNVVESIFGTTPVSFIPPENQLSSDAKKLLGYAKYVRIVSSAEGTAYDLTTYSQDYEKRKLITASEMLEACKKKFTYSDICVIALHPQDFETHHKTDPHKYKEYVELLNGIQEEGWATTTIQLDYYSRNVYSPDLLSDRFFLYNPNLPPKNTQWLHHSPNTYSTLRF